MKSLAVLFVLAITTLYSRANLAIGDSAPPISILQWIKHGPIDMAAGKGKNIYVVEFWATWCGPCRETIPHMTELQKKYRDRGVVFMGLTDEAPSLVKSFVQRMGDKMDYAIGIDERDKAYETYMKPFDQDGIPHAFIVDKEGRLVWHGHPTSNLDKALDELVSGKFNLDAAKKYDRLIKMQVQYIDLVNAPATRDRALEIGNTIITDLGKNIGGLNAFAWKILTDRRIKHRDASLAVKAAKLAYELGGSKDPSVVDTYARALFEAGQKQAAIEQQKAAIALAKEEGQRIEFEGTLKKYQRLLRESGGH